MIGNLTAVILAEYEIENRSRNENLLDTSLLTPFILSLTTTRLKFQNKSLMLLQALQTGCEIEACFDVKYYFMKKRSEMLVLNGGKIVSTLRFAGRTKRRAAVAEK